MTSPTKINGFVEHLAEKEHNLGSDQLTVALSNTDPTTDGVQASTAAAVLATVTQISYTNLSSRNLTTSSSAQTSGTYDLILNDLVLTSSGGSTGPFRYVYIYNDTSTSDKLINVYDNGSSVTLNDGETFTIDFTGDYINLS
jgi:hypothetical protein